MSQIYLDGKNIQYLSTYLKQKLLLHTKLFTKKIFLNLVLINILKINRFPFLFSKSVCKKGFQFFREQQKNIGIYLSSCTNKTSCSQIKRSSWELDFYRYTLEWTQNLGQSTFNFNIVSLASILFRKQLL